MGTSMFFQHLGGYWRLEERISWKSTGARIRGVSVVIARRVVERTRTYGRTHCSTSGAEATCVDLRR